MNRIIIALDKIICISLSLTHCLCLTHTHTHDSTIYCTHLGLQ